MRERFKQILEIWNDVIEPSWVFVFCFGYVVQPIVSRGGGWGALGGIEFATMLLAGELWGLFGPGDAYVSLICRGGMSLGVGY